jgi:hypothetical protein
MASRVRVYVVTAPEERRGIYDTWDACRDAVRGVAGARYQAVASRAEAETLLRGEPIALVPGLYAFVDGNHAGGIGVVIAEKPVSGPAQTLTEVAATVHEVFAAADIPVLSSPGAIAEALARLRNVLAELGALHAALGLVPAGAAVTVVHDYEGVGAWMTGRWKTKDPTVAEVVAACRRRAGERGLQLAFRHQRGHQSVWAGVNEWAALNHRADALATRASR